MTARVPRDAGDAYVTVQTFQMLDDLYCKAINGRTIAIVNVLEPKERDKKMVVVEGGENGRRIAGQRNHRALRHLLRYRQGQYQAESEPTL